MKVELPDRRVSANLQIVHMTVDKKEIRLQVTIGYGPDRKIREVFCADFKAGSEFHALVMDTCILVSRLLQFGDTTQQIMRSLSHPLVLTILRAVEEIHQ